MEATLRTARELGAEGERLAKTHLVRRGHRILDTNWRYLKLEIDIVSCIDETIVFTEVKLRGTKDFGEPEMFVTPAKQRRLIRAANTYLVDRDIDLEARFDIVAVTMRDGNDPLIEHLEDAFYPVAKR